ncbi:TnsA endonuclease N-terminal domain-containing protein [Roseicyclus sp. F158]|uniref:TnsA endonuclease N-terminal domain-containing protein n=1 Tax=Tropicimonas omnivorans TaxID=3075590 RepID=A0ABU3DKE9_9RHOB|nr:TnsA endonuclease N-terminal domain-containing protein [Roseicyclus sp. F158]MDT0684180.1 TnsA endonuclease N-terminal domain-containing protein [Roseicyclus sp. F158]
MPSRAKRKIPKSSRGHFVGELVFNRGAVRQRLGFASLTEHNAALCLIYRPDFHDIEEQLASLPFVLPNGESSEHFFDFLVTFRGGRQICISVKPERIAQTYKYQTTMARIKQAAIGNICDDVRTITERNINPVELHNAKLFHSARDLEPRLDAHVIEGLANIEGPVRVRDFLAELGVGGSGFRSVARAVRFGQAKLFAREKITAQSLIIRGDTG